jgi:hypothetical protein
MLQLGRHPDFPVEPFGPEICRQFRVQNLDGDLAPVLDILGQIDSRHPASAELALDTVAIS